MKFGDTRVSHVHSSDGSRGIGVVEVETTALRLLKPA